MKLYESVMARFVMYYTYILKLSNNSHYIGFSSNLKQRVEEHRKGKVNKTKYLLPLKLEFYAAFSSKLKALRFEKYLKTPSGFAFRNKRFI